LTNAPGNPDTLPDFNTGDVAPEALTMGASNRALEANAATPNRVPRERGALRRIFFVSTLVIR
jgi:hypothetical protein